MVRVLELLSVELLMACVPFDEVDDPGEEDGSTFVDLSEVLKIG